MTDDNITKLHTALLVCARHLVHELSLNNYAIEWTKYPLKAVLQGFYELLDLHPSKPGSIIQDAFEVHTHVPRVEQLPLRFPDLFAETKQAHLDEYAVQQMMQTVPRPMEYDELETVPVTRSTELLKKLAFHILRAFEQLTAEQENEHRTLERMCLALGPVYACADLYLMGWDLAEYADFWRKLDKSGRLALGADIKRNWP